MLQVFGEKDRRHAATSDLGLDGILLMQRCTQLFQEF
jgi:hypothetical protein